MIDTRKMCLQHLLGEHLECHMLCGSINKGIKMDGYISNSLLQIQSLKERHDKIAQELKSRKFKKYGLVEEHKTPLKEYDVNYCKHIIIDVTSNEIELANRCKNCRKRMELFKCLK